LRRRRRRFNLLVTAAVLSLPRLATDGSIDIVGRWAAAAAAVGAGLALRPHGR
jgi:hypothetical protein